MSFDNWDEVRTAYQVARMRTVSGAAEVLGVHHATVIRHIDALEARLGVKLFQRHTRGYTPTEAGRELLDVAHATSERFAQLASRIKGQSEMVTGELVVTAISGIPRLLTPVIAQFQDLHPGLVVRFHTDMRLFKLNSGEAHVAIRAGARPDDPDYVVQKFIRIKSALYASKGYAEKYGLPKSERDFRNHRFIGSDGTEARAPFYRWQKEVVPQSSITFYTSEPAVTQEAVRAGAGLGFLAVHDFGDDPDLIEVMPPRLEWDAPLWLVTHVDLHRTLKVQRFLAHLKGAAEAWSEG